MNITINNQETIADMTFLLTDGEEGTYFFENYKDIVCDTAEDNGLAAPRFVDKKVSFYADEEGVTTTTSWGAEVIQEYPLTVTVNSYTGAVVNIFNAE